MNILAVESSAIAASAALWADGTLRAEAYNCTRLTHSQTLLPLIADLLRNAQQRIDQIDAFAVAAGPGSFTGVRIGVAAVKGLAMGRDKPCVPVSTLAAMAYLMTGAAEPVNLCAVMDARCGQVYNALFRVDGDRVYRLCPDRAVPVAALDAELAAGGQAWTLVGDGTELCVRQMHDATVRPAPPLLRMQRAGGVAMAAAAALARGESVPDDALVPLYLRPPQAEREWQQKHGTPSTSQSDFLNINPLKG